MPKIKNDLPPAFLTGSRAYGKPRPDSDVDLVILTDAPTCALLKRIADNKLMKESDYGTGAHLMFGKLNLIVCTEPFIYEAWVNGTRALMSEKPATRERAVKVIGDLRFAAVEKLAGGVH